MKLFAVTRHSSRRSPPRSVSNNNNYNIVFPGRRGITSLSVNALVLSCLSTASTSAFLITNAPGKLSLRPAVSGGDALKKRFDADSIHYHFSSHNNRCTRLYSTLLMNEPSNDKDGIQNGEVEEEASKWERMYAQGEVRRQMMVGNAAPDLDPSSSAILSKQSNPVRVVSFDLDNTLWRTSAVIDGANDALAAYLQERQIQQPVRTEVIMKELFIQNKTAYAPLLKEKAKGPVNLTQLRKDAIQKILVEYNGYTAQEAKVAADEAFDIWTGARHDAIPANMAEKVVETLNEIRALFSDGDESLVKMGAITDGNSDPTRVESLRPYFDFCINAESVGVSKPDPRVYLEAMQQVTTTLSSTAWGKDCVIEEDQVGTWWVHVGDDFVKDVVAAKGMGMRTIWCRELVPIPPPPPKDNSSQQRTVEDFVKEVSSMKVVRMQLGADDYLADTLQEEFADAVVDTFAELPRVLKEWHAKGLKADKAAVSDMSTNGDETEEATVASKLASPLDKGEVFVAPTSSSPDSTRSASKPATDTKFCVFCGEKLPKVAKFCFSCGEKQPELPA